MRRKGIILAFHLFLVPRVREGNHLGDLDVEEWDEYELPVLVLGA
jgi:hypothetical protein